MSNLSTQKTTLLQQTGNLLKHGRVIEAKNCIDQLLMLAPDNVDVLNFAVVIAMKIQNFIPAENYLKRLMLQCQDDRKILLLTIDLLEAKQEYFNVLIKFEEFFNRYSDDLSMRFRYGLNLVKAGKILLAEQVFLTCQKQGFNNNFLLLNLGHVYKAKDKSDLAAKHYQSFIASMPSQCGVGYWSLADLKDYIFTKEELLAITTLIISPDVTIGNLALLYFAQARAYEQTKEYSLAFSAMSKGNEILNKYRPFKDEKFVDIVQSMIAKVTKPTFKEIEHSHFTPIFIVGMPRSGTTLVEQIIASHSTVESTDELQYIERIAIELEQAGGYAKQVNTINEEMRIALANKYEQQVQQYFSQHQAIIIDKNPNNFMHIGLIKTLFPQAKIINVIRNPLDNAMSVFKQYFSQGHEYSYSLKSIALYWQQYLLLMEHWQEQFGDDILQLSYEELTQTPEQEIRRLLTYCHLAFEKQCLTFHQSTRVVLTPSVSQVKQPINQRSVNSWQQYQEELKAELAIFDEIVEQAHSLFSGSLKG